ncbi:hypothetical protein IC617_14110 [Neiella sp. HB171785]|uniref:DUF707 domain-containing protein n=1 Tax=Neiella litorisoli TaxID=2771431 RepID=A0A8J6QVI8_9GAMM|nr:DUF707 domain-containing protein [Neiella litorisoli]MBD1390568.1 hypothetical protein [Neiella litorisoli]
MEKAKTETTTKNLVFSSVGDKSNVKQWLEGKRNFDLFVCYYGDNECAVKEQADYYLERKGGKFPNLKYVFDHHRDILDRYDAIYVSDDDIGITTAEINQLFSIRQEFDLWVLQPAFSLFGKISHSITKRQPTNYIRYTNFLEVTCPLFRTDKLTEFLDVYDPSLIGYGVDWWFLHTLGYNLDKRVAIVDAISCLNPRDDVKGGTREIASLQSNHKRMKEWDRVSDTYDIKEWPKQTLGVVKLPLAQQLQAIRQWWPEYYQIKIINRIKRKLKLG